jgi:hypothetical protein
LKLLHNPSQASGGNLMNIKDLKLLGILGREAGMPETKLMNLKLAEKTNTRDLRKRINNF